MLSDQDGGSPAAFGGGLIPSRDVIAKVTTRPDCCNSEEKEPVPIVPWGSALYSNFKPAESVWPELILITLRKIV